MENDIRWVQRFDNYKKGLLQLSEAVVLMSQRDLSNLEKQGLVQAFEFTYELGWNLLKDYLQWQGFDNIVGSRDTIRQSYKNGLISDGQLWMAMLQDRNRTVHTYNEETTNAIIEAVQHSYIEAFEALKQRFDAIKKNG